MHEKTTLCTLLAYFYSFSSFQGCNLDLLNASITLLAFQCNVFGMFASSHLDTGLFVSNWTPMNLMLKSIQESLKFSSCQCKSPQTYKGNLDGKSVFWDLLKDSVKHVKNIFKTSWRGLSSIFWGFFTCCFFLKTVHFDKRETPFRLNFCQDALEHLFRPIIILTVVPEQRSTSFTFPLWAWEPFN